MLQYINYYECPRDETRWEEIWECKCNDRCPTCNSEVTPYRSKEIGEDDEVKELICHVRARK